MAPLPSHPKSEYQNASVVLDLHEAWQLLLHHLGDHHVCLGMSNCGDL